MQIIARAGRELEDRVVLQLQLPADQTALHMLAVSQTLIKVSYY